MMQHQARIIIGTVGVLFVLITIVQLTLQPFRTVSFQQDGDSKWLRTPQWMYRQADQDKLSDIPLGNATDQHLNLTTTVEELSSPPAFPTSTTSDPTSASTSVSPLEQENIQDVFNSTLGFQEVIMLSLPFRGDRQDTFAVQAQLSNITWTQMWGVEGKDVPEKALPYGMTYETVGQNGVDSWRAHLNALRYVVKNKLESAIIFEDDADWDVSLRYQLVQYAKASRYILRQNGTASSPYGDGWDVLTIGHCDAEAWKEDMRRWVIPNDPTVIAPHIRGGAWIPDMKPWQAWNSSHPEKSNNTRICFASEWNACTTAYAISLTGAMKILYYQSMTPFADKFDNGLGNMLRNHAKKSNFTGVTCYPTYIGVSHGAGTGAKTSDIDTHGGLHKKPYSERLQFPLRKNIERLFRGDTMFEGEYSMEKMADEAEGKKPTPFMMNFTDIIQPEGRPEVLVKVENDDGLEYLESVPEEEYLRREASLVEEERELHGSLANTAPSR